MWYSELAADVGIVQGWRGGRMQDEWLIPPLFIQTVFSLNSQSQPEMTWIIPQAPTPTDAGLPAEFLQQFNILLQIPTPCASNDKDKYGLKANEQFQPMAIPWAWTQ